MKISVSHLLPGMRLAKPVYGPQGELFLNAGVLLNSRYITSLKRHGIPAVYIGNPVTMELDAVQAETALEDEVKIQTLKTVGEWFTSPDSSRLTDRKFYKMVASVETIIDEILSGKEIVGSLTEISATDCYTFTHSVDVCVLAILAGAVMGYSRSELSKLGVGSLLHDLGKTQISPEILHKPGKLTDEEFKEIKKHPVLTYKILKEKAGDNLSPFSLVTALNHHERYDGSGYPRGLKGKEIHDMAGICAICDVYNAMTTDRVYRKAVSPHEVYKMLMDSGGTMFKSEVLRAFLACVSPYPVGSLVKVNTREEAYVVETDPAFPFHPKIFLLHERRIVDLQKEPAIEITGLLESKERQQLYLKTKDMPAYFTANEGVV